jgi:nucleotide-binding universal stress UspA family protein
MHRSIVVPLDGTSFSERALGPVARVAAATGASVHLVRVTDESNTGSAYPAEGVGLPTTGGPQTNGAGASAYLEEVGSRLAAACGATVRTRALTGPVARAILEYADRTGADGVALSTRAPGTVGRALLGSVADELLAATRLPVLAVPPGVVDPEASGLVPILVAVDADTGQAIADVAGTLALALGGSVALVHVVSLETISSGPVSPPTQGWEDAMRPAENEVDRLRERLRRRGVPTEAFVLAHRSPDAAIREVAGEVGAGLLALGSHRKTGLRRLLLGSVATQVLTRACRPVLIQGT